MISEETIKTLGREMIMSVVEKGNWIKFRGSDTRQRCHEHLLDTDVCS